VPCRIGVRWDSQVFFAKGIHSSCLNPDLFRTFFPCCATSWTPAEVCVHCTAAACSGVARGGPARVCVDWVRLGWAAVRLGWAWVSEERVVGEVACDCDYRTMLCGMDRYPG
jgi:hypothetical protein